MIINREFSFNLIDKPWIWVLKTNGSLEQKSLYGLFNQADDIYSLSNENIYVDVSIWFLLSSILYVAYSRDNETQLFTHDTFMYRKDVILDYLNSVYDKFDIYDKEYPFMQVKQDSDKLRPKEKEIECLNPFSSSTNKESQWSLASECDDSWIARNLLTYRMWHALSPAGGGKKNGIQDIKYSFLNNDFSLVFIKGDTLTDTFCLNFKYNKVKESMHPIWEEYLWDVGYDSDRYKEVNEGSKITVYYDAIKPGEESDIARVFTYSNVNLSIDPKTRTFKQGYNIPIKLFIEKDGVRDWSKFNDYVGIYTESVINKPSYSIQKEIINRGLNDGYLLNAKNVILVRPPEMNSKKVGFTTLYVDPVNLIGNGILKAEEENRKLLYSVFSSLCKSLENYEIFFKKLPYRSSTMENKDPLSKRNRRVFNTLISQNTLYSENSLYDLTISLLSGVLNVEDLDKEYINIRKQVYRRYLVSYKEFIKVYCPYLYFELKQNKDKFKDFGVMTMSKLRSMNDVARNFKECLAKDGKDLVKLRDMRKGKYIPNLNLDSLELSMSNKQNSFMVKGIQLALDLWSNHQHSLEEGKYACSMNEVKDQVDYRSSFGNLLYILSKDISYKPEGAWDTKLKKYERSSSNIDSLVRFMKLTIKEAVQKGINVSLDYGRLAYMFSKIVENRNNISDFLEDVMIGFYIAKRKDKKEKESE